MTADPAGHDRLSFGLPVLILAAAVVASLLANAVQSVREHQALAAAIADQVSATGEGDRLRQQLEGLLSGATALARAGNAAATAALDELSKQGVTYTPPQR